MPRLVPTLAIAGAATVLLVGGGLVVLGGDDADEPPTPPSGPVEVRDIALDDFDTAAVAVGRDAFCEQVPAESVTAALGRDEVTDEASWGNGDDVVLDDGSSDVAHEFGCRWESTVRRATTAVEAWVYAPPVTETEADGLREAAVDDEGCTEAEGAPAFGDPSLALTCTDEDDGTTTTSFRGLFGDAWLTCRIAVPTQGADATDDETADADLLDRTGRWCVTVARAAEAA